MRIEKCEMRKFSGHFFLSLCEKNWCGLKNGDEFGEGFIEKKRAASRACCGGGCCCWCVCVR